MKKIFVVSALLLVGMMLMATRKALIIGNSAYGGAADLASIPINDAQLIDTTLRQYGFTVTKVTDANKQVMKQAIETFAQNLSADDEVFFYYSGHGVQVKGANYLMPIGHNIKTEADCEYEAIDTGWILSSMDRAGVAIIVLDACRNNPYIKNRSSSLKGLAAMNTNNNRQYIIYSTESGQEALNGTGMHSPFVESFVNQINSTDKKIEDQMKDVKKEVLQKTNGSQSPTAYGILVEDFYFKRPAASAKAETEAPKTKPAASSKVTKGTLIVTADYDGKLYQDGLVLSDLKMGKQVTINNMPAGTYEFRSAIGNAALEASFTDSKTPASLYFRVRKLDPVEMIMVEGGSFVMGDPYGNEDNKQLHRVTLSTFYIGKYEITNKQYEDVMLNKLYEPDKNHYPVGDVTWFDAIAFCNRLSIIEALKPCYSQNGESDPSKWNTKGTVICDWSANGYRLPTEAEWEYAARGGKKSKGYQYSGSDDLKSVGWYEGNSWNQKQKIGLKSANEIGIYDMSGNQWEWCWDWYDAGYYSVSPEIDPRGPGTGQTRLLRGGNWCNAATLCRVSYRDYYSPCYGFNYYGFRLCRAVN
jgi:formylglycine-generating enzyme required for sulfatase activity